MKLSELSDRDKVQLILSHVYGCLFVENEEAIAQERSKPEFHYPIAFFNRYGYWSKQEKWKNARFFDPLRDVGDAWDILWHMNQSDIDPMTRAVFDSLMENMEGWWKLNAYEFCDAVCKAALKACGVEVEP